jgi:hypothetical protein
MPPPPPAPPPPPPGGGFVPPPPGGYAPTSAGYAAPRTDGLAIASLIIGILALVCSVACLGLILGPAAAITGFIARQRITSSGGTVGGGTLAVVGLVLGIVGFLLSAGAIVLLLIGAIAAPGTSPPTR